MRPRRDKKPFAPGTVVVDVEFFVDSRAHGHRLIARVGRIVIIPVEKEGRWANGAKRPRPNETLTVRIVESEENRGRRRFCELVS